MKCHNCKFKSNIAGDAHVSCKRAACLPLDVNQHGVDQGWFIFPVNFDPTWAKSCTGFVDRQQTLSKLSNEDLNTILQMEFANLKVLINKVQAPRSPASEILNILSMVPQASPQDVLDHVNKVIEQAPRFTDLNNIDRAKKENLITLMQSI
jgi:hypothetical protein